MGKPSIFSNNYKQQVKKRRLNTILFVLLVICIAFFGGKYYLNKNNISISDKIGSFKIVNKISSFELWSKLKNSINFNKKKPEALKPQKPEESSKVQAPAVTPSSVQVSNEKKLKDFQYTSKSGTKFSVEYEITPSGNIIVGFLDPTKSSDYNISRNKTLIVFDIKADNSIITCDSKGNFKEISRAFYKMVSSGKILTKESVLAERKDYLWAAKPFFTLDGRVVYISRLPYVNSDSTLYLWSVNIDGSNHKKISKIYSSLSNISYTGYDAKGRLLMKIDGKQYYLDNGSYMLRQN